MTDSNDADRLDEISDALYAARDNEDAVEQRDVYRTLIAELEALFARWQAAAVASQLGAALSSHPDCDERAALQARALAWYLRAYELDRDPWNLMRAAQIHFDRGEFAEASALCARVDTTGERGSPFVTLCELALCGVIETRGERACVDELRRYVDICRRSDFVSVVHFNLKRSLRADPARPPPAALLPLRELLIELDKPEDDFFAQWFSLAQ